MYSVKEKVSNATATAKEHIDIMKAKAEEKAEKGTARTKEEKVIAHERRKAKEAEASMRLHEKKAQNSAEKLHGHHTSTCLGCVPGGAGHHHDPVDCTGIPPTTGTTGSAPAYPLGQQQGVYPPGQPGVYPPGQGVYNPAPGHSRTKYI